MSTIAAIPLRWIGPIKIIGPYFNPDEEIKVPLATFETPLWPSTQRGARVSREAGGIRVALLSDQMTRSIVLEASSVWDLQKMADELTHRETEMAEIVSKTSRFARLINFHYQIVGNLFYLRLAVETGDASGHNMATKAAEAVMNWLLKSYPLLQYVSISGNFCTDKKVSAVNGILGRGKQVVAEITISPEICHRLLHTTPEKIVALHIKKNLMGSILAGSIRSANAHFANILLAFYLSTGQDAANIVEGSQGIVHTQLQNNQLYFSITLPHAIVGTVGNGKDLKFVQENLDALGCLEKRDKGINAQRLALILAATVLCGELSLLAAQTNPGELVRSHLAIERRQKNTGDRVHD